MSIPSDNDNDTNDSNDSFAVSSSDFLSIYYEKNYPVMGLYIPVFLSAVIANSLVIVVVIKYQNMRNVTNYFLVNLSLADLLVSLVCMPTGMLTAYVSLWNFGELTCKITNYLQCVAVAASIFTITAMAVDRYLAITQPFGLWRCFNRRSALLIIASLWTMSLVFFAPMLYVYRVSEDKVPYTDLTIRHCYEEWAEMEMYVTSRRVFGITSFVFIFATPGALILVAYSLMGKKLCSVRPPFDTNSVTTKQGCYRLVRERKRVAWILLMLTWVFCCCWLPYNTLNLLLDMHTTGTTSDGEESDASDGGNTLTWFSPALKSYLLLLGHANSALNPIIYCIMSRNFRKSVRHMLTRSPSDYDYAMAGVPRNRLQVKWVDSSRSSQRLCLQKLHQNKERRNDERQLRGGVDVNKGGSPAIVRVGEGNLSRGQSSQKTTKTCAV